MTLCIVQARYSSERFRGKVLADLAGKPVLQHVLERVQQIRGVDRVVLAIPEGPDEQPLTDWAQRRYSELAHTVVGVETNDVLGRFAAIVRRYQPKVVLRVTGDCPLVQPLVCERVIQLFQSTPGCEYAWTDTHAGDWPDGLDVEVFSAAALLWAEREATDSHDREHVTSWLRRHVKCAKLPADPVYWGWPKCSIDTPEDLVRVEQLVGQAWPIACP